jgi:hypothetical protein
MWGPRVGMPKKSMWRVEQFDTLRLGVIGELSSGCATGTFRAKWGSPIYTGFSAWQGASGQEKIGGVNVALQSIPLYVSAGNDDTCGGSTGPQPCPTAYQLQHTSAMSGTGLNLNTQFGINMGTPDYHGDTIPNGTGTGYNVGADGAAR